MRGVLLKLAENVDHHRRHDHPARSARAPDSVLLINAREQVIALNFIGRYALTVGDRRRLEQSAFAEVFQPLPGKCAGENGTADWLPSLRHPAYQMVQKNASYFTLWEAVLVTVALATGFVFSGN